MIVVTAEAVVRDPFGITCSDNRRSDFFMVMLSDGKSKEFRE